MTLDIGSALLPVIALVAALCGMAAGYGLFSRRRFAPAQPRAAQPAVTESQTGAPDGALALQMENERLRDEIWELKGAEAERDRAAAASESKTRFLATISHEMRTPLNGILGMANLMRENNLTAEQLSYLDAICTSASALATLIDEVLDFSRIEAGKLDLVEAPFDLVALVEGVVELLAPRAQGKGLEIAASLAPSVAAMRLGDGARLRQVLINLAGNAVKFTARGGVGVRVSPGPNGALRFAISDTGPGIPAERQEAIFEDFEQADGSATRSHEGTGLGLAISRRIVARMGGELTLEQSGPLGSVFTFELALPEVQQVAQLQEQDSLQQVSLQEPAAASGPRKLQGRRALIIANSPFQAPYLGETLTLSGADVSRASGEAAGKTALFRDEVFDIVIIDCALGEDAIHRLALAVRESGAKRSLVLFSPFERRAFGQQSLNRFDGWLVKPVRASSLLARLCSNGENQDSDRDDEPEALPDFAGRRIFVAEDNDINALVVTRHLQKLGAEVVRARDGHEALETLGRAMAGLLPPFDAALLDIRMPGLDGMEVARRIRAREQADQRARLPMVALTANAFHEDRQACMDAGIDEFLTKPVDIARLAQVLAQALAVNRAASPATPGGTLAKSA